jgi:hypothetical protein
VKNSVQSVAYLQCDVLDGGRLLGIGVVAVKEQRQPRRRGLPGAHTVLRRQVNSRCSVQVRW